MVIISLKENLSDHCYSFQLCTDYFGGNCMDHSCWCHSNKMVKGHCIYPIELSAIL